MEKSYLGSKSKVKRIPKRGHYDEKTLYKILDSGHLCHLGFSVADQPFVIPTLYGREEGKIFLHGASTSRMLKTIEQGIPVCLTVTHVDALVLARSAFHHSMNYRSAVIFGTAFLVVGEQKKHALKVISDHIIPGRWEEVRTPNEKELKATSVLQLQIEEASCKIRSGPPSDEKEDIDLGIWAGIVPMNITYGQSEADEYVNKEPIPASVRSLIS